MRQSHTLILSVLSFAVALPATLQAQKDAKNEVGLVIGSTLTTSQTVTSPNYLGGVTPTNIAFSPGLTLGADYDHRFLSRSLVHHNVAVYGGVDFLATPLDVKTSEHPIGAINQYAYVFITPHVRVKFRPGSALEPWLTFGGGYARFRESAPQLAAGSFQSGTNTGTLQFGSGVDFNPSSHLLKLPIVNTPIGFRAEVRDFLSGQPNYNRATDGSLQNNVVFTGGVVLRF